ncbi:MAG TPA: hypothetical protein DCZ94_04085 [Lentisphaeria bacterium]|nr:MAG: hypothetical protein A2X48_05305 [Lentisphaerae bacterium GWF2_49_21]HBC86115.1 hypothetical protein [Lentisphaeria bacterium]
MNRPFFRKSFFIEIVFIVIILASSLLPELSADEAKQKIKFFRPSEPGNVMVCDIGAEAKAVTVMTNNDGTKAEKVLSNKIAVSGVLTVMTVTDYGRPATIEFKIEKVEGDLSGREVKFACDNKVLKINLETKPCEFRIKDSDAEIGREEILLLSLVFRRTRKENMSDFIGTENAVGVGDEWKTPLTPLQDEFEKRGLKAADLKMNGNVKLMEKKAVHGYDCWILDANLDASKDEEFVFEFKAEICLPVDGKTGAVKISRLSSEKFSKKVDDRNNALMPDVKEITMTITDKMATVMVPVERKGDKSK